MRTVDGKLAYLGNIVVFYYLCTKNCLCVALGNFWAPSLILYHELNEALTVSTSITHYLLIDFGMMGEFRQELRDGFIEACLHLVNRDFDALAKDFITLG